MKPIQASYTFYPTSGPSTFSSIGMVLEREISAYMSKIASRRCLENKASKTLA
jgi:hypothetical protein